MELVNTTPYAGQLLGGTDLEGAECVVVIAKATFQIAPGATAELAEEQRTIETADVYAEEPGASSLLVPSDLCISKPGTDAALLGSVSLPDRQPEVEVLFQVGPCVKRLRVSGPRVWERVFGRARISQPEPAESVPLLWEDAFGGVDASPTSEKRHDFAEENPIGKGFRAKRSKLPVEGEALPALEDPTQPIRRPSDRPRPWCTGFVAPGWLPRSGFAGTYDDGWLRSRSPLLPKDFDPRYYDRGSADLVAGNEPKPGDVVRIAGASLDGDFLFPLPEPQLEAGIVFRRSREAVDLHCDTILVDLDARQLAMTWSGHLRTQGRTQDVLGARLTAQGPAVTER